MPAEARLNWSLSRKITLLLAALGILLIAVAVVAFRELRRVDGTYARLFEEDAQALLTLPRMNVALLDTARLTAQRLSAGSTEEAARLDAELAGMPARLQRETEHLRHALPQYSQSAADIERAYGSLLQASAQVRQAGQARRPDQAQLLFRTRFVPQFDRLRRYFDALGGQISQRMRDEAREAERVSGQVLRRTLLVSVIALAAGLGLGQLWVWRSLARPMQGLVAVVRRLMAGDTNVSIPGGERADEIGLLASALGVFRQNLVRKQQLEDEERAATERVEQSRRLLQQVTDNAEAYIFAKDAEGRYLFANRLYVSLLKRPVEEIIGKTVFELFAPEAAGAFVQGESTVLAERNAVVLETAVTIDGRTRHFLAHKFPLFDRDGRMFGLGGVSADISDLKQTQEELARARDAAEAANRAKSAFVATMSHEIRTPMNAIINLSALALESELPPRQRQYISVAHSSARGLLALLNDILDFSKIEAGRLELEREPFQLRPVLEEVANSFRGRVLETGLEFAVFVADEIPDGLVGDTLRLRQVLINLLGNAFKFTERGAIVLRVTPEPLGTNPPGDGALVIPAIEAEGGLRLRFGIRDTGIGIPREKLAQLFEAFSQADTSTSRKYGGTGLGLAISRRLVGLMGGEIRVESAVGQGSEFSFTAVFGRAPLEVEADTPVLPRDLRHTRALVVSGSELSRELIAGLLRRFGLDVALANSGEEALVSIRAATGDHAFGLAVVDTLLPDLSGLELVRRLRRRRAAAPAIVLVAGHAGESEEREARAAGIKALLLKPVTGSLLLEAVVQATELRPEIETPATAGAPEPTLAGRRILVAEDNEANQFVVREILQRAGARVEIAVNGREAVDRVAAESWDLVLMDMQMPGMDGLEATRRIRADTARPRIPIVALTANAMASDVEACRTAGMDDYVAKPIERTALFATLARWLPSVPASRPDQTPPSAPTPATTPSPTIEAEPTPAPANGPSGNAPEAPVSISSESAGDVAVPAALVTALAAAVGRAATIPPAEPVPAATLPESTPEPAVEAAPAPSEPAVSPSTSENPAAAIPAVPIAPDPVIVEPLPVPESPAETAKPSVEEPVLTTASDPAPEVIVTSASETTVASGPLPGASSSEAVSAPVVESAAAPTFEPEPQPVPAEVPASVADPVLPEPPASAAAEPEPADLPNPVSIPVPDAAPVPAPAPVSAAIPGGPPDAVPTEVATAESAPAPEPGATTDPAPPPAPTPKPRAPRKKRAPRDGQLDLLAPPLGADAGTEAAAVDELRQTVRAGRLPGIDLEDVRQRLGLPPETIEAMLLQFGKGLRRMLKDLRSALDDDDAEESRRHAHSLAGAAGNLSVLELRRLAKTVELAIKFGQGDLAGMMSDLEKEADRVLAGLAALSEERRGVSSAATAAASVPASGVGQTDRRPALERLASALESGDLDAIQQAEAELEHVAWPAPLDAEWAQVREFIAGFEHESAARRLREWVRRAPAG